MKPSRRSSAFVFTVALALSFALSPGAGFLPAVAAPEKSAGEVAGNVSLKFEVRRAIEKGLDWVRERQDAETGAWGDDRYPAITALSLCAMLGDPALDRGSPAPATIEKGFDFLLRHQNEDGGIYKEFLATYNTSLSLLAFSLAQNPDLDIPILKARKFLIGQQSDYGEKGSADNALDGGVGYGGTYTHSDLSNTHFALEALHYSRKALADTPNRPGPNGSAELDWDAAMRFVERCQNLPASNDQEWASSDADNRGGFIYFPGDSKAGLQLLADGRKIPRSYGSMTYAGLLSFIYAEMDPSDERVVAALDWLKAHYSIEENPGMEHEGLFYYYHTMAKALSVARIDELELADGSKADWRLDLARKLFDLQQPDGSWVNDNGRWWEKDPALVTAYAVLTLEHIYHSL